MSTASVWEGTRTFFPLFVSMLEARAVTTACVVGASDGKFVLPLARRGIRVVAIERDPLALEGGPVVLPGQGETTMAGLRWRLADECLTDRVIVVEADVLNLADVAPVGAVWTSCSWHYSVNHRRPLGDFIAALRRLCRPGGLFGAEYMMPVQPHHFDLEHYPGEGVVRGHLSGWPIDWECYTPPFVEEPHVEQPATHVHRMGLIIATRP
jgi:SAM-dependent methyltransferase